MNQPIVAFYRSPLAAIGGLAVTGFGRQSVETAVAPRILPSFAVVLVERGAGWLLAIPRKPPLLWPGPKRLG